MIRFQHAAARTAVALLGCAIAIALIAGLGTRWNLWPPAFGQFRVFPYSLYAAFGALVLGLAWALTAFASGTGAGARYGVAAILASLVIFWVPARDFWMARVVHDIPPVSDISTDTEHAPDFIKTGGIEPYDGLRRITFEGRHYAEEALQRLYYGDIKPYWQLGTTGQKLYNKALVAARAMGWNIVATSPDATGGRIQATDTTLLFGLRDDVAIRVKPAGIGARLDIRSRSGTPGSDLGRNAARIRAYLKRLASS